MNAKLKIFGILLLFGGGAYAISRLKKISATVLSLNPPKISNGALVLSANVAIDNPVNVALTLKKPTLRAFYNGNEVGNSIPSDETISVKANERTTIHGINIQIPFTNLGTLGFSLLTGKMPKVGLDIEVNINADGVSITQKKHFDL